MEKTVEDIFELIQKLNLIKNEGYFYDVLLIYTFFQQVIVEIPASKIHHYQSRHHQIHRIIFHYHQSIYTEGF